jgi:ABC-2 type transport system permease protein
MNLIKNEVFKVFRLKKLYIFMAIIIVLEVINGIYYIATKNNPGKIGQDIGNMLASFNGQSFPVLMLQGMGQFVIIFMAILLADIISDEYKNGTLKLSLLRPVTRVELLFSKIISLLVSLIVLLGFILIVSYIIGTLFCGWGDKTVVNGVNFTTAAGIILTLKAYLITILPYFAFGMIIVFTSILFTSMGATIGVSLGVMIVLGILENIKQVHNYSILHQFNIYSNFVKDFKWSNMLIGIANVAVYLVVFYIGSMLVLKKKDILS